MVKCAIILPSATTNGPFSFSSACPLLSFLFLLSRTSSNVSDCINSSPSSLLSNLSSSPPFPCPPPPPPLSLSLHPQLISPSSLICPFQFHFFLTLPALERTHVACVRSLLPRLVPLLSPRHWQGVTISCRTRLLFPSWGHVDLPCPFSGTIRRSYTNVTDPKGSSGS